MKITEQELLNLWSEKEATRLASLYDDCPERKPKVYKSNQEALNAIREAVEDVRTELYVTSNKRELTVKETSQILSEHLALLTVRGFDGTDSLVIYNYDTHVYEYSTSFLNDCVVAIMGMSSNQIISSVMLTLSGMKHLHAIHNPLPEYKIAVGNGIFNCLTKELEDFTPEYTVLTKISTNYIENAPHPEYEDGFTFESMIYNFANGNKDRIKLLHQICKSAVTGVNMKSAMFIALGNGGDGKSTFFTGLANMIGQENVAYVNFSEFDSNDKMLETLNKKLVLGLDNDSNLYIRKTARFKSMASHETMTFSRKYLSAISAPFTAVIVQLCNDFPRFSETGSSMKRRIVTFKAENSYYEAGTENDNVDQVYIKDPRFHEYMLYYILNTPYYSDYNDVDREVTLNSLDSDDIVGQFVEDMDSLGVFDDANKILPIPHLFAAYRDWMELNNSGSRPLASRGLTAKLIPKLAELGYSRQSSNAQVYMSTLTGNNLYFPEMFGDYVNYPHLSEALEQNYGLRYFEKTHERKSTLSLRSRNDKQVTALQFFKIENEVMEFATEQGYELVDEVVNNETQPEPQPEPQPEQSKPVETQVDDKRSLHIRPPGNIIVLAKSRQVERIKEYLAWLEALDDDPDNFALHNILHKIGTQLQTVAVSNGINNPMLLGIAQEVTEHSSVSDLLHIATRFVNELIEILEPE